MRFVLIFCLILAFSVTEAADTSSVHKKRVTVLAISYPTLYSGAIWGFNELWYKNSEQTNFHWFDDSKEWQQIDKMGHAFSAFHEGRISIETYKWAGLNHKKSAIYGGLTAFMLQAPIELLDGFSEKWGASASDLAANTVGAIGSAIQYYYWQDYKIHFKYAFIPTNFAEQRPEALGSTFLENLLKDYNGQSYWISTSLSTFSNSLKLPPWIGWSIGYGAHNMLYAYDEQNIQSGYTPYRQFFFGPDIIFSNIKTKSKVLRTLFFLLDVYKLPIPAVELNTQGDIKLSLGK